MTLVMMLVTPYGVWSCSDHRLTEFPSGKLITDSSVKQVAISCRDGSALVSYSGLGRLGRLDVSEWLRGVLRGGSRTIDETQIDLREQATARIGLSAYRLNIQHFFLIGAYYSGHPWAIEIRNFQPATVLHPGGVQPELISGAQDASSSVLMVGGSGRDAVLSKDLDLLLRISKRRPKRVTDYMQVLADINQRAAEADNRQRGGSRTTDKGSVSRSCIVSFMPPSGAPIQTKRYGASEGQEQLNPFSQVLYGIDAGEIGNLMSRYSDDFIDGVMTKEEFSRKLERAARAAIEPRDRRQPK